MFGVLLHRRAICILCLNTHFHKLYNFWPYLLKGDNLIVKNEILEEIPAAW